MADTPDREPPQSPLLPPEEEEVDVLFKAQMWIYDKLMAHWRQGLALVGLFLLGSLIVGLFLSWHTDQARATSAAIASVDRQIPEDDELALMGLIPRDDLSDPARVSELEGLAQKYEAAAADGRGAEAAQGYLKAAETWHRVKNTERAMAAYEAALAASSKGLVGYAARNGLAALALSEDRVDDALAQYRAMADGDKGYLGEKGLLQLAALHQHQGDDAAARAVLDELRVRYADSPRVEALAAELGVPPAPAPEAGAAGEAG
ncbi:MAG: hypothetical protein H6739_03395 [Alphaproteobacteria bacterium]|nr:hypothetical protein [Alphaproteobacteria bacterium]